MRPTALPILLAALTLLAPACGEAPSSGVEDEMRPTASTVQLANPPSPPAPGEIRVPITPSPDLIAPAIDLTDLPPRFTDHVPQYQRARNDLGEEELVTTDPIPFDMILIPGDAEKGISPFYLGETEAAWAMMVQWMYCEDVLDVAEVRRLINEGLRPTPLYGEIAVVFKLNESGQPAISLTRLTCESFCVWLSEKTGRQYRLPTPAEWELALRLGGGCPSDPEELLAIAFLQELALLEEDPFFGPLDPNDPNSIYETTNAPIQSLSPNSLGIYDMLGNVGEWVVEPGGPARVVGGHFAVPTAEMSADWTDVENHDIWNAAYPNRPYSHFWYYGRHHFQGFRLVCEVSDQP